MPSPFPGMDPYLERPNLFPDLHGSLIFLLKQRLQGLLPEPYYASSSERTWIEASEPYIEPDVDVVRISGNQSRGQGTAVAATVATPIVITVPEFEHTEAYLEIYLGPYSEQRLVTTVEILSPSNKKSRHKGRKLYRRNQRRLRSSNTNLVEIDFLRAGEHTTAIPEQQLRQRVPAFDYHVCVHRFHRPSDFFIYPIRIEQELPAIGIPLLPDDGEVEVPIQELYDRAYVAGAYQKRIDYSADPPPPPFDEQRLAWIRERIQNATR